MVDAILIPEEAKLRFVLDHLDPQVSSHSSGNDATSGPLGPEQARLSFVICRVSTLLPEPYNNYEATSRFKINHIAVNTNES